MDWTAVTLGVITTVIMPIMLPMIRSYVESHVRNQQLQQWAMGATAAAGRALIEVQQERQANPNVPIADLARRVSGVEASKLFRDYAGVASSLGADESQARSRVLGELGKLLAQPGVTAAAVPAIIMEKPAPTPVIIPSA